MSCFSTLLPSCAGPRQQFHAEGLTASDRLLSWARSSSSLAPRRAPWLAGLVAPDQHCLLWTHLGGLFVEKAESPPREHYILYTHHWGQDNEEAVAEAEVVAVATRNRQPEVHAAALCFRVAWPAALNNTAAMHETRPAT